jgi:hypothetical protein
MFEYNYDVVIRKFSNSYIKNFDFLMKSPNTSDTHFVDNLYLTIGEYEGVYISIETIEGFVKEVKEIERKIIRSDRIFIKI